MGSMVEIGRGDWASYLCVYILEKGIRRMVEEGSLF